MVAVEIQRDFAGGLGVAMYLSLNSNVLLSQLKLDTWPRSIWEIIIGGIRGRS